MTIRELIGIYKGGVFNTSRIDGSTDIIVGGQRCSDEQARYLLANMGWLNYYVDPIGAFKITEDFVKAVSKLIKNTDILENTTVEFQNMPSSEYEKTFDRISIHYNGMHQCIIHGMKGNPAAYTIYTIGNAIYTGKARTMKSALEEVFKDFHYSEVA